MKKMLVSGKQGQRTVLLFSIGIDTAYHVSDLRQLKLADVVEISRGRVIVKECLAMKEQKTGKHNSIIIFKKLRNQILDYCQNEFAEEFLQQNFNNIFY